jgi:hypothetical protein
MPVDQSAERRRRARPPGLRPLRGRTMRATAASPPATDRRHAAARARTRPSSGRRATCQRATAGAFAAAARAAPARRRTGRAAPAGRGLSSAEPDSTELVESGAVCAPAVRGAPPRGSSPRPISSSRPRPARAAPRVSVRFGAEPTPTTCTRVCAGSCARDRADDLLFEADQTVGDQHDLALRAGAQRRQRLRGSRRASRCRRSPAAPCEPAAAPRSDVGLVAGHRLPRPPTPAARGERDQLQAIGRRSATGSAPRSPALRLRQRRAAASSR